ncbi:hypothetical protein [Runella aurantiaca]|uniref:Uncharacterized protein n=1 Tax=Runella aurantiaca TaxID=2282308 RepID=A0A369I9Q7_9BACT|nr:hypothetical protein [Runella aurantiaca]RDB05610.1 hypothetical protein DVG78_13620 [Runella aurantiaca]
MLNPTFHSDRLAICQPLDWTPAQLEDALSQLEAALESTSCHSLPNDYIERLHYHLTYLNHQKRITRKNTQE